MNYLDSFFLIVIVLIFLNLIGILVAHGLFRLLYLGRSYKGIPIAEDLFILIFTIPSGGAVGYIGFLLPTGLSLLISVALFFWFGEWPADEPLFSINNLLISEWPESARQWRNWLIFICLWLVPVITVSIVRRRKKRWPVSVGKH
ncbi:MAG: hypothetical protein ABW076_12110 [Candidatus Thiodiazotropha sp.]